MKRSFNCKNRKILYLIFGVLVFFIFSLTIVYAVLSVTLNISGNAEVVGASWDIHLDNIKVNSNSVEGPQPTITGGTTATFTTILNKPGDFYEFTIDVVNDGTIDAMIYSVIKSPDLTTSQAKYLSYIIEYQNGETINTKQLVEKKSFVRLKVRVEYRRDLVASDLPMTSETLNLAFNVNYIQSDGTEHSVTDNGVYNPINIVSGNGTTQGDEICIGEECFYVMFSTEDSVTMLAKYNLYVGGKYENYQGVSYGSEATGRQDSNMLGYIHYDLPINGVIDYSNDNYWHSGGLLSQYGKSYPSYVYDNNSILYNYVENYKNYLMSLGVDIQEARLIKSDELINLGCKLSSKTCSNAPSWVYSTSYWTGTAYDSLGVLFVATDTIFNFYNYYEKYSHGIRPVLVISSNDLYL